MAYKQKTKHYKIPVLGYGDKILPEIELQKWQVVENLIIACLKGEMTAIFKEGELSLKRDEAGKLYAVMYPIGNGVICSGISNGAYFESKKTIQWGPLSPGGCYYLYIQCNQQTFFDSSKFRAGFSDLNITSEKNAIVAKVDLRGDTYSIDRYPPGKVNPLDLSSHVQDNDNPHGEMLKQKNLDVSDLLQANSAKIGELYVDSLIIGGNELKLMPNKVFSEIVEAELKPGVNIINSKMGGRIVFAQSLNSRVRFGLFGSDTEVHSETEIAVYNDSSSTFHDTLNLSIMFS